MNGWAHWRGEIAKGCDGSHQTIEGIDRLLATGAATALEGPGFCLILQIHQYPAAKACQVLWAAGDIESLKAGAPRVHEWAKAQGCTEMLIEGHPGWKRALEPLGYGLWSVTLRRPL